ncbi:hypothetical protein E2C06_31085 [Dankookia rubra]|uniref:Uncharacterized protein n=1 Tax=Dankookia rubra TaxID=1442381 RepID=A0A4R5Q814_9PROT|nr:hypothetical protein E2C06_31085 [Dankookia rubra]
MTLARGDAMDRYWTRFRTTPPMSILVGEDGDLVLIVAMDAAVARGRPMSQAEVLAIAGMKDPGPDPDPRNPRCM